MVAPYVADSRTWGIFIRDSMKLNTVGLYFIESQWNMPYLAWKYLTYGSLQPPNCYKEYLIKAMIQEIRDNKTTQYVWCVL